MNRLIKNVDFLKELAKYIEYWAEKRNFFGVGGANKISQFDKLIEEAGEMHGNLLRGLNDDVSDDIGDQFVVLIILNKLTGGSIEDLFYGLNVYNNVTTLTEAKLLLTYTRGLIAYQMLGDTMERQLFSNAIRLLDVIAYNKGFSLVECVVTAYENIKDRKGKFLDGAFIKESDLKKM